MLKAFCDRKSCQQRVLGTVINDVMQRRGGGYSFFDSSTQGLGQGRRVCGCHDILKAKIQIKKILAMTDPSQLIKASYLMPIV